MYLAGFANNSVKTLLLFQGEPGLPGDRGPAGMKGMEGATGDQGRKGDSGPKGHAVSAEGSLLMKVKIQKV